VLTAGPAIQQVHFKLTLKGLEISFLQLTIPFSAKKDLKAVSSKIQALPLLRQCHNAALR